MRRITRTSRWITRALWLAALLATFAVPTWARLRPDEPEYQDLRAYEQEVIARIHTNAQMAGRRGAQPMAIPDIFGQGSVLNVGNFVMKVTNNGLVGNPFTNVSSDPSGQWPGTSAIEYLNFAGIAVGAVNPFATDPNALRRVSYLQEWRPATLDPEDRIYRGYDGIVNGTRFVNDDSDRDPLTGFDLVDEDFLDGRDNDGDGRIDEDFGAIGQQMYTCVIRDDTPQAVAAAAAERHVPLGIECRQTAWAYSIPGFTDFDVVNWKFINRSGHDLDSVAIGFRVDMDCGPVDKSNYFSDDFDAPQYPYGRFVIPTPDADFRKAPKGSYPPVPDVDPDSALCPRMLITVQGFSVADDDGDDHKTTGVPHFLLIDHTIDPTGENGPRKVGFRAFRSFPNGQPYVQGGNPTIDQQRFEFMTSTENIANDPATPALNGFINAPPGDQKSDYSEWASIGPWLRWAPQEELEATVAIGVRTGDLKTALAYSAEYQSKASLYKIDPVTGEEIWAVVSGAELIGKYPALDNAIAAQLAFEGAYEVPHANIAVTDFPGRETPIRLPAGQTAQIQGCEAHDPAPRFVDSQHVSWFDFDCDYCTGVFNQQKGGLFHHTWLAESPPPSPGTNLGVSYNYTDNPDRRFAPGGDGQVTIAWDNLSEVTADPKTAWFDFRGYKIWKVSNWTRPVGSGGPGEDDWTLLAEYRLFDYAPNNKYKIVTTAGDTVIKCPRVYIPQVGDSMDICLDRGDLWDRQSGNIIKPNPSVLCVGYPNCVIDSAFANGTKTVRPNEGRIHYPVGRYAHVDRQVKNGFLYFYSVSAFDSTGFGGGKVELNGRRAAVEAEGVVPQSGTNLNRGVWVVPNPYRGLRAIQDRPSAWDLTPNASDPTGTHIDFLGLPGGKWSIKIFTLSGDLVVTLSSDDAVNASTRNSTVIDSRGVGHQNVTRQQDTPNDGQARWNLISRNGQDVVSGIYLFTVESTRGTQRGKFVIIR
ncbi:MAG TPA: hypothetical protein VI504_09365 [Candidatus Eisenbacteria bacterium]